MLLNEEGKPLGLQVSWAKTKAKLFRGMLDEIMQYAHGSGKDIKSIDSSTKHGSIVHNSGRSCQEVFCQSLCPML